VLPPPHRIDAVPTSSPSSTSGSQSTGLPGADLSAALATNGPKTVVTVDTPTGTLSSSAPAQLADSFFQVSAQESALGTGQPLHVQTLIQRSGSAPRQSAWEELDASDSPWWDTPGSL